MNYYILSLSQNYDDLAMWRMYAKDGCSIKFNSQKLNEFLYSLRGDNLKNGFTNLIKGSVNYNAGQSMDAVVKSWLEHHNEPMIYDDVLQYCLSIKSPDFSFEHEYRFGIPFEDQYLGEKATKEFTLVGNTIRPQLELKKFPVADVIKEITISPFVTSELTKIGLQELLKSKNMSPDIVKQSSIKIR